MTSKRVKKARATLMDAVMNMMIKEQKRRDAAVAAYQAKKEVEGLHGQLLQALSEDAKREREHAPI
jgi:hypothetical protein